jgi:hypothetical protein
MTSTDELAPYPTSADAVTADRLARYYAVAAQTAWTKWTSTRGTAKTEADRDARELTLMIAIDSFGVTHLLRALQKHAPDHADDTAVDLWSFLDDGGAVGEGLWAWLTGYGIDPEAINAAVIEGKADGQ